MVECVSPLEPVYRNGRHGRAGTQPGVALEDVRPGSIVQLACWPGHFPVLRDAVKAVTKLDLPAGPGAGAFAEEGRAFSFAPNRVLVAGDAEDWPARLAAALPSESGTVTDLGHGRTVIAVAGPKAAWVLAKLYAIDFSETPFPVGRGIATAHHDVFTQMQRTAENRFELYVFRSFARSFWKTLCDAAEEVGYEVL